MLVSIAVVVHATQASHAQTISLAAETPLPSLSLLVPSREKPSPEEPSPEEPNRGGNGLTQPAADMRDAILEAVHAGKLEALRTPIELNELKPAIGDQAEGDPIERLQALAQKPGGQDILAIIAALLDARWTTVPLGPDPENSRVFVWPHFAEAGVKNLSKSDEMDLQAIAPPEAVTRMRQTGTYDFWRLGIGADGTWHFLRK